MKLKRYPLFPAWPSRSPTREKSWHGGAAVNRIMHSAATSSGMSSVMSPRCRIPGMW